MPRFWFQWDQFTSSTLWGRSDPQGLHRAPRSWGRSSSTHQKHQQSTQQTGAPCQRPKMLLALLGEAQLLSREGAHLYLKHQRRSGVPSVPLPTVTISPERKAFLRNTGKERSMSRMVVAHCQGHQGLLEHGGVLPMELRMPRCCSPPGTGSPCPTTPRVVPAASRCACSPWRLGPRSRP